MVVGPLDWSAFRHQAPESLGIRTGDEGFVMGLQLIDGVAELLGDVDRVAVQGEPVAGGVFGKRGLISGLQIK
ncbi:MAG: hypothetical protein JNL97_10950 [Verrucomicrobiales bacterium]|nr:hypothetical protein [Verrucomicrobiales bacterium]